jgi:hypothetical protein
MARQRSAGPTIAEDRRLANIDGRHRRSDASREAILFVCRSAMQGGDFRPTMAAICRAAGLSIRTGFQLFDTVEALHLEALKDCETGQRVLDLIFGRMNIRVECRDRLLRAIVTGRVEP